jgi:hypothetical protein
MTTTSELTVATQGAATSQLAWLLVGDVADILDDGIDAENLRWLLPVLESLLNLMNTEEQQDGAAGYLDDVLELSPNSFEEVEGLHAVRNELRADLHRIIGGIRQTIRPESSQPLQSFVARSLSAQLMSWVDRMTTHHRAERELSQSVWYLDLGVGD